MPWVSKKRIQRETMLLKTKLDLQEASFASAFQQLQQSLNMLSDRLDKIEKRLDNMQAAQGHVITVTISFSDDKNSLDKTVVVTASASDNLGHAFSRAALWVDDRLVSEKTASPWTWDLDTTRYSNGQHRVKIGFWCASGGYGEKTEIVNIQNVIAAGGASTSYTPTGGGGQHYESHGCSVMIASVTPLNGSEVSSQSFPVYLRLKDSIGHPILEVQYRIGDTWRDASRGGENLFSFQAFFQGPILQVEVQATCAAGSVASALLTYYRKTAGVGGEIQPI